MKNCLLFLFFSILSAKPIDKSHLLYLLHKNQVNRCIDNYQIYCYENKCQDFSVLEQIGLSLIEKGIESEDKEIQMLSLLGAGLSAHTRAINILEKGIYSKEPELQMLALHFLSRIDDVKVDEFLTQAMRSAFLPIRMEAAFYMAEKKHAHATGQIEALMHRLPPYLKPFFPQFFALNGTKEAISLLKKFIHDPNVYVRVETINALMKQRRDDFLPTIRKRLIASSSAEKEICALAVGLFQDKESVNQLEKLALSKNSDISLSAMKSLYHLGKAGYQKKIEALALQKSLFAINALSDIPGSENTLYILTFDRNIQVRINAICALLRRKDVRAIEKIDELLIQDQREFALQPILSLGKAHHAFRCIPSSLQNTESRKINLNLSFAIKESLLQEALHLDQDAFLGLAEKLFEKELNALIPELISLLESIKGEKTIALLKKYSNKTGAPLIRTYCQLALFRMQVEGPYHENICQFIEQNLSHELIELRPMLSYNKRLMSQSYRLTDKETTQLLIDSFIALVMKKDEKSISTLLSAIKKGNPKNRYALAGLLLRAVE